VALSFLDKAWYPTDASSGKRGVYVFQVGTSARPDDYKETLDHVASHGFIAVGVGNHNGNSCSPASVEAVIGMLQDDSKLPAILKGRVDGSNVGVGGHSGGGPCALKAAGRRSSVVHGSISQHGAAIPFVNRLTDAEIRALPGAAMTLCGTVDPVPFCGCINAQQDYYGRFATTLPRVGIAVKGVDHLTGTQHKAGDTHEGGYIVAFLYAALQHNTTSAQALLAGIKNRGDASQSGAWPPAVAASSSGPTKNIVDPAAQLDDCEKRPAGTYCVGPPLKVKGIPFWDHTILHCPSGQRETCPNGMYCGKGTGDKPGEQQCRALSQPALQHNTTSAQALLADIKNGGDAYESGTSSPVVAASSTVPTTNIVERAAQLTGCETRAAGTYCVGPPLKIKFLPLWDNTILHCPSGQRETCPNGMYCGKGTGDKPGEQQCRALSLPALFV